MKKIDYLFENLIKIYYSLKLPNWLSLIKIYSSKLIDCLSPNFYQSVHSYLLEKFKLNKNFSKFYKIKILSTINTKSLKLYSFKS